MKGFLAASISDSLSVRLPKRKPDLQSQLIPAWYTTASCNTEMGWAAGISHILAQLLDFAKQHSQALVEAERDMGKGGWVGCWVRVRKVVGFWVVSVCGGIGCLGWGYLSRRCESG